MHLSQFILRFVLTVLPRNNLTKIASKTRAFCVRCSDVSACGCVRAASAARLRCVYSASSGARNCVHFVSAGDRTDRYGRKISCLSDFVDLNEYLLKMPAL